MSHFSIFNRLAIDNKTTCSFYVFRSLSQFDVLDTANAYIQAAVYSTHITSIVRCPVAESHPLAVKHDFLCKMENGDHVKITYYKPYYD